MVKILSDKAVDDFLNKLDKVSIYENGSELLLADKLPSINSHKVVTTLLSYKDFQKAIAVFKKSAFYKEFSVNEHFSLYWELEFISYCAFDIRDYQQNKPSNKRWRCWY